MSVSIDIIKLRKELVKELVRKGILEENEYEEKFRGRYTDSYGSDGFLNYLSYVVVWRNELSDKQFLTLNEKLLKDKEKLEKRFKLKIIGLL